MSDRTTGITDDFTHWLETTFVSIEATPNQSAHVLVKAIRYPVRLGRPQVLRLLEHLQILWGEMPPTIAEQLHDEYGRCPHCGGKCIERERRLNGNDRCENGHVYPSREAVQA